ncbi:MAG: YeeE/YedE family protein [Alphaproteobacteria bacterium]|nr:YeeE/YedE family protein [Alphaproteobacteria bacterium]
MPVFIQFLCGLLFGAGLIVSDLANPPTLLGFFDIAALATGGWDPTLLFGLIGAVGVTFVGYRIVFARHRPIYAERFELPSATKIDARLLTGAALFGLGWGIAGLCPSPAVTVLGFGGMKAITYATALLGGMFLARTLATHLAARAV